nr:MerR family transcriptional regulator [Chloroflexota bacterium]
ALDRATFLGEDRASIPPAFVDSGRNDTTVLFYSPTDPWELPFQTNQRYCVYAPPQHPQRLMILIVAAPEHVPVPVALHAPERRVLFDRILAMCEQIFQAFRPSTLAKNYRYRSDGFPIEQTQATYQELLKTITELIFPGDPVGMAALLIPNSLDRPATLSVLAHHNYGTTLAPRAKLDLHGDGQGLCGRAYNVREPFYSRDATTDPRVAYAVEEDCHVALAVPFTSSWGVAPFGVLYLASRDPQQTLTSDVAYLALILSNILSEQLGRWWLTRLRKSLDLALHQRMHTMIRWFDGLDPHGPDFTHALDDLHQLWQRIGTSEVPIGDTNLALVLFDIDRYRQHVQIHSTELVPLAAQTHVRNAIQKIQPVARDYWFKNDHVLVLLHKTDAEQAIAIARRIANQVRAVPPNIQDATGKPITLTVSAAIKVMTYEDVRDLDRDGAKQFRDQMALILDQLMQQTAQSTAHTLHVLTPTGWQCV